MELYTVVGSGFRLGWRALGLEVRTVGHDHVPAHGPAILAANHVGYLDFCFVALAPPRPRRQVRFLIRDDVYDHRLVGAALHRMRQIPVATHGDPRAGLERAEQLLGDGEVVGIHPEGTISPSFVPQPGRTGAVRLAQATGAPIVPVAVWGSQRLLTKWRPRSLTRGVAIELHYGAPRTIPADADPVTATVDVMAAIEDRLVAAQTAYPQTAGAPPDDWWLPAHLGGSAPTPLAARQRLEEQAAARRRRAAGEQ